MTAEAESNQATSSFTGMRVVEFIVLFPLSFQVYEYTEGKPLYWIIMVGLFILGEILITLKQIARHA